MYLYVYWYMYVHVHVHVHVGRALTRQWLSLESTQTSRDLLIESVVTSSSASLASLVTNDILGERLDFVQHPRLGRRRHCCWIHTRPGPLLLCRVEVTKKSCQSIVCTVSARCVSIKLSDN